MKISGKQIKMARAFLDLSQEQLASAAGLSRSSLNAIESGKGDAQKSTLQSIVSYCEANGVKFTENNGISERPSLEPVTFTGQEGFRAFYDDVYATSRDTGKEILIFNGLPNELINTVGQDWYEGHAARMKKLGVISKNIIKEGETNLIGRTFALYRTIPAENFRSRMIYVYGNKLALFDFDGTPVVKIIDGADLADSLRDLINLAWEKAKDVK